MSHISDGVYLCHNCNGRLICPHYTKVDNAMKQLKSRFCSLAVVVVAINTCFLASLSVPSFSNIHACKYVCISPKDCFIRSGEPEVIESGKRVNEVLCFDYVNQEGRVNIKTVESAVTCEVTHESTGNAFECEVIENRWNEYQISYQPTSRGRHQQVEGEHIKGSPFPVTVKIPVQKLGTPIKTISGVKAPWGVGINKKEEILVAERRGHCISIFSPTGEKLRSFGLWRRTVL